MIPLKDFFADKNVTTIIDIGTGTGDFIEVLNEVFPEAQITGTDPNTESLSEATKKFPDLTFIEMSGENLKFSENTFDLASISMALHHLTNVQNSLKELQRVVKPGGWIIVNELFSDNLNPAQETHKMYHHFRSKIDRLTGVSHQETFEKGEILDMVKRSGIDVLIDFENTINSILIPDSGELEERIEKMKKNLDRIKDFPQYELLKQEINEFRERFLQFGFQSPPRIVLVGKPGK